MMTEAEAKTLLKSRAPPDQIWRAHSITVARAAGHIVEALSAAGLTVDPALARVGGFIHDIGRSVTHDFSGHAWAGSQLLIAAGEPILARFCTTHQCGGLTPDEALLLGWPAADYRPRSWEEKAVTIADGLAYGDRIVLLTDRCSDVRERYRGKINPAHYQLLVNVEAKMRALMAEVEMETKHSVEEICGAGPL
jgi:putative nucleotidyltransferase with HDIG domain